MSEVASPRSAGAVWRRFVAALSDPADVLRYGVFAVLLLMPFHAALVVVVGSWNGHPDILAAWKEVLILVLLVLAAIIVTRKHAWRSLSRPIPALILAICTLGLLATAINQVPLSPLLFGIKTDVFPWLLLLAALWASRRSTDVLHLPRLLTATGVVVSLLAIVQHLVIRPEWLSSLGYGATTIIPSQFISWGITTTRAFSTLGGPNQLGAYLLIPLACSIVLAFRKSAYYALTSPVLLYGIFLSFSRSAWIAAIVVCTLAIFLCLPRRLKLLAPALLLVVGSLAVATIQAELRSGTVSTLERILLHGQFNRTTGLVEGSDVARTSGLKQGLADLVSHPFGLGFGAAGPASFHTTQPRITENWFLQIGLETGWLGLGLVLLLLGYMALLLLQQSADPTALAAPALVAALGGILVCNLFLHSFADSTLALVFYGTVGLTLDPKQVLGL